MPRHSPCALSSLTCSSQSPLGSVSAFQRKLRPLPCSSLFAENSFSANGGRELRSCSELSENSWFSLRIMQAYKDRNCMSPCILSDAVPQSICFVMCFHTTPLCCLTCFVTLFSFQGAEFQPLLRSDLKIRSFDQVFKSKGKSPGGPEWARTTDLTIISRTL